MEAKAYWRHEIDINPKPEDIGTFKVYVSIIMPGSSDERTPRRFLFSLQHDQSLKDCASGLRELKDSLNKARVTKQYADHVQSRFTRNLSRLLSSGCLFTADTSSVYLLVSVIHPQVNQVIRAYFTDDATDNIRFRQASKVVVGSLSRKVYNTEDKVLGSDSMMCTICMEEFKNGERFVILPCGHAFGEGCIVDWFETSHVCPLCRFELPCQDI